MNVSRRHMFGLLAGAAVAPHLPASAPLAQVVATAPPINSSMIWAERLFEAYVRESAFAPYLNVHDEVNSRLAGQRA